MAVWGKGRKKGLSEERNRNTLEKCEKAEIGAKIKGNWEKEGKGKGKWKRKGIKL